MTTLRSITVSITIDTNKRTHQRAIYQTEDESDGEFVTRLVEELREMKEEAGMKITGETITDEQIRELREAAIKCGDGIVDGHGYVPAPELLTLCHEALAEHSVQCGTVMCSTACAADVPIDETRSARARCAEIWNMRTKETP